MRKLIYISTAVMLLTMVVGYAEAVDVPKVYKVGALHPLSGPMAFIGHDNAAAGAIALEEINAAGGVDGVPIQIIIEDNQAKAEVGTRAFKKLVEVDKVPISIGGFTGITLAIAPMAEEKKVLYFDHAAVSPSLLGCGKYTFTLMPNALDQLSLLISYWIKELNFKRIGVLWTNDDMGRSMERYFRKNIPKLGGIYAGNESIERNATEANSQVAKARQWGADAIYIAIYGNSELPVIRAHEIGWKVPMGTFSSELMGPKQFINAYKATGAEMYGTSPVLDFENPKLAELDKRFMAKCEGRHISNAPLTSYSYVYIAAELIKASKAKGGDFYTGERLRAELLNKLKFTNPIGLTFVFDPVTHGIRTDMVILKPGISPKIKEWVIYRPVKAYSLDEITKMLGEPKVGE